MMVADSSTTRAVMPVVPASMARMAGMIRP
jgi:hypothetical protein